MRCPNSCSPALVALALVVAFPCTSPAAIAPLYDTTIHPWMPTIVERDLNGPAMDIVNLSWDPAGGHPPVRLTWYRAEDGVVRATSSPAGLNTNSVLLGAIGLVPGTLPTFVVFTPSGGSTDDLRGYPSPGPGGPGPGFTDRPPAWTIPFPSQGGLPEFYVLDVEAGPALEILLRLPPQDGRPPDRLLVYDHLGALIQELDLAAQPGVGMGPTLDFGDLDGDGRFEIMVRSVDEATLATHVTVLGSSAPIAAPAAGVVSRLSLGGPIPHPVGSRSEIRYAIPRAGRVRVRLFDAAGRHVRTLADGLLRAGEYTHDWDGTGDGGRRLPPGVYLLELESDAERRSRKVVLLR